MEAERYGHRRRDLEDVHGVLTRHLQLLGDRRQSSRHSRTADEHGVQRRESSAGRGVHDGDVDRPARRRDQEVQEEALKEGPQEVPEEGEAAPGLTWSPDSKFGRIAALDEAAIPLCMESGGL